MSWAQLSWCLTVKCELWLCDTLTSPSWGEKKQLQNKYINFILMHFLCKYYGRLNYPTDQVGYKKRSKLFIGANRNAIPDPDSDSLWCLCAEWQTKGSPSHRKWFQSVGVYGITQALMMMSQEPASPLPFDCLSTLICCSTGIHSRRGNRTPAATTQSM